MPNTFLLLPIPWAHLSDPRKKRIAVKQILDRTCGKPDLVIEVSWPERKA